MITPIGVSDFRTLIEYKDLNGNPYLFIDKSMIVAEILFSPHVTLITRPRRFGKTLNMSLLHHFFSKEVMGKPTGHLFKNLEISKHPRCMQYQGKYPIIFLSFKEIKGNHFEKAYEDLKEIIRQAYKEHERTIYESINLTESDKEDYLAILNRKASDSLINISLKNLTQYLTKVYGVKPIILIDEYDTPIQTAYLNKYYAQMVELMKGFLGYGLKDNPYLEKAVLTGILRVSKESIFSDLNHLKVYTLLDRRYGEFFGFTEQEVITLLEKSKLISSNKEQGSQDSQSLQEVRSWYNGYQAGDLVIYNPWSIINYIEEKGKLKSYWVNTSANALIKTILIKSPNTFKIELEALFQGKTVEKLISEHFVFEYLDSNENALWSLLFMSGYLKATPIQTVSQGSICQLSIPNKEVSDLFQTFIAEWLSGVNNSLLFNHFLSELLQGEMEHFEERLQNILLVTCSVHDVKGKNPEKFYHGFLLGLLSGIDKRHYTIDSNKEAGFGRFDIIIAPILPQQLGIIIELKSIEQESPIALKKAAIDALHQIEALQYDKTALLKHTSRLLKIGIAFSAKELAIVHKFGDG